jgi:phosphatidylglycerophosphate synthase
MKIPNSQENPFDIFNIWVGDKLCPLFKSFNMTPNNITTLSLIFGTLSVYYLYKYNFVGFAITYYISYLFDCMDGNYARKYKMVTKFGDYYDHVKDFSIIIGLIITLVLKYKVKKTKWIMVLVIMGIFTLLFLSHFGCQERIYDSEESPTLKFTKSLCPGKDPSKTIQYTKWFGCGTFQIIFLCCIFYISINRKKR